MSRDHCLFTYEIAIDDRLVIRRKRQFFMESIFRQIPELRALGPGVATDYASLVVTSARVNLGLNDQKTFTLTFYDTELPGDRVMAPPDRPFKLQMSLIGPLSSSDLSRFMGPDLTNSNRSDTADIEAVRALNVIMASHPNKDPSVYQGSRNKFFRYPNQDTFGNYDLEAGLIAVRGFYSSVRFSTSRILLNLNAQCSPFYKVMNARKLVEEFLKSSPGDWPAALESFLSRLRVTTSYMKAPDGTPTLKPRSVVGFAYKTVQISETDKVGGKVKIELLKANEINFQRKEQGPTVSVQEYFLTGEIILGLDGSKLTGSQSTV